MMESIDELREMAEAMHRRSHEIGLDYGMGRELANASRMMREAADTIENLAQKVEDLEGMLGELPPEGKCAMLLVKQVGGEYVWDCEKYDFASYCLVDSEADTYTGMTLNDPFGRADFADKLTMAKELHRMAASLEAQGDVLGIIDAAQESCESNYTRLFGTPEKAAQTITRMQMATDLMGCCDADSCPAAFNECWKFDSCPMDDYDKLLEWLREEGETE